MRINSQHNFLIFILIIVIAFVLRGYNFFEIPFTHDEFSAYFRTKFDNFSDLIAYGARIDGHPAGIQVFLYYWIQVFGAKEWVVKLPFFLFGMASIVGIYKLGKLWFNDSVGLISAAFMAVSQFAVMYSQIARPYISGLFFTLLMCWYWSKLIKTPNEQFWKNGVGFVLGAALCTYNHHFSMLFAVIVGLTGVFIIQRKFLLKYLLLGVIVFVLYLPHLEILFHQMSMKGVEGWLAKPENDFIIEFVRYIFNYSWWFLLVAFGVVLFGFYKREQAITKKRYVLFSIFFFVPFLIGFFYSIYVNALLQFSVLIFSYPFLYFLLFGHLKNLKPKYNLGIVSVILLVGLTSLIFERKHYDILYNDHFEHVLLDFHDAKQQSTENIPAIIDSRKDIVKYYAKKHELDTSFYWYDDFKDLAEIHQFVKTQAEYHDDFYLGANSRFNPMLMPLIQHYFPHVIWQRNYFIGTHFLFSKSNSRMQSITQLSKLDFKTNSNPDWGIFDNPAISSKGFHVDNNMEWTPAFEKPIDSCITHQNDFIEVALEYNSTEKVEEAVLVISVDRGEEQIHWLGIPLADFQLSNSADSQKAFASLKLSDIRGFKGADVKIYVWNKGKEDFYISDLTIFRRNGNPIVYGLFEKLEPRLRSAAYGKR